MLWARKTTTPHERSRHAGIDCTASRILGATSGSGKVRPLTFDGSCEELRQFVGLDGRNPAIGEAGYSLCRKAPHAVCSNFLPALAQSREWRCGRNVLTPESALELALLQVSEIVLAESEAAALTLPSYLTPIQVSRAVEVAAGVKFPLKGTAVCALALVAVREAADFAGKPIAREELAADGVIRFRPTADGPGTIAVVDVDEYALSTSIVAVERDRARLVASAFWPRLSQKAWKDRSIDAIADRCVRLCRRDPRDSAEAEQALFEQLDEAPERIRTGQRVNLTVRTAHWFQDVILQPDEFDGLCSALALEAGREIHELAAGTNLPNPPREIWLTHEASRLPGLRAAVQAGTPESTTIAVLPQRAAAHAAVSLVPRWLAGELPRAHLDSTIPIPTARSDKPIEKPKTGRR